LRLPEMDSGSERSRRGSFDSLDMSDSWSNVTNDAHSQYAPCSYGEEENPRGHKQELITEVRETLTQLLGLHFPFKMDGSIMAVFAHQFQPELDELKDVLRGNNVGNVRAKSVRSLNALVQFLHQILNCPQVVVHRVDVILQKKKSGHLKGLLVNIQFTNQAELLFVRDAIWKGMGFEQSLPKFMPAVFAQDCSWKGRVPKDLFVAQEQLTGDIRVQNPLPKELQELGLEAPCRIKSISVICKAGSKKAKTFEIPKEQYYQVLVEGRFTVKGNTRRLSEKTRLTVSFEEDWKTNFWRSSASSSLPTMNFV